MSTFVYIQAKLGQENLDGGMNEMTPWTLPSRHRIRYSSHGELMPKTLRHGELRRDRRTGLTTTPDAPPHQQTTNATLPANIAIVLANPYVNIHVVE